MDNDGGHGALEVIALRGATRRFGARPALDGVTLSIRAGERVAVLGPSGAGKTTLLRLIARLDRPEAGDVRVAAERIGMVFQTPALWPHLTVRRHLSEVARNDGVDELMRRFDLAAVADRKPGALSGGEAQRLSLARAVAHRPQILLLDEPYTGLDPMLRRELSARVEALHDELGLTTVHVTHVIEAPVRRANRVILLRDGRVQQEGTLDELTASPNDPWVKEFFSA